MPDVPGIRPAPDYQLLERPYKVHRLCRTFPEYVRHSRTYFFGRTAMEPVSEA